MEFQVVERDAMQAVENYEHLEVRPRSNYRQLWLKGRHIRAEVLYRHTIGPEPRTPEEVADDYNLPVAAVREAVDYSIRNQALLDAERERADERLREAGLLDVDRVPESTER